MQSLVRLSNKIFRPPSIKGNDWQRRSQIYLVRLGAGLCLVLIPAFGVLFHAADPLTSLEWYLHVGMEVFFSAVLFWTFVHDWPRDNAGSLLLGQAIALTFWSGILTYLGDFASNNAIGFFLTAISSAVFLSLAFDRVRPLAIYSCFALCWAALLVVVSSERDVDAAIYLSAVLVSLALVYVAVSARLEVQAALSEREGHLNEAQKTASLGNWELDIKSGRLYWSPEMYRVVGVKADSSRPSFEEVQTRLHPDDVSKFSQFWGNLLEQRVQDDLTLRLRMENGVVRTLRLRGEYSPSSKNSKERVFGICQDVTVEAERERVLTHAKTVAEHALEEAERAREQAEEMARMKSEFLANMSHEIRTPLTAIIGFAQVLGEEVGDDKKGLVEPIEHSGKRLLTTLNSVLDLAQMRADGMNMEIMPVDVAEEAHEFAEMLRSLATEKGLTLTVNGPVCGLFANADKAALSRVLTNLVSNAIKFTDKGRVTLSVDREDVYACIRVRDTGRGIGAEFLPKLFEEFRQESTGTTRSHEGSGLGLAITKGLVEQMGGTISVDSTIGEGSVFTVLLPLSPERQKEQVEESSIRHVEA